MDARTLSRSNRASVLAPDWYAVMLGDDFASLDDAIAAAFPPWLVRAAGRAAILRGLFAFRLAGQAPGIAVILGDAGTATLLFCEAWLRRRRAVVVLELIPRRPDRRLRRAVHRLWSTAVLRPAIRRAMAAGQVLGRFERERYAAELRVPIERIAAIPWALSSGSPPGPTGAGAGVLASGRAWCDWETLFAAARARDWPLTVVYGERYRRLVPRLAHERPARLLSEITWEEHEALVREAAVFVIPLRADAPSAGQVRLMTAIDAGTAVVASRVPALEDYVEDGVTAVLVEPGEPEALAAAIERLLASPTERERLAASARERARRWTYAEYVAAVRGLIDGALGRAGAEPAASARDQ